VRLTGSAEEQYTKWRKMLKQIYAQETGFYPDLNPQQSPLPPAEAADAKP
jgi:hypothetical protein